jgi:hypothetical protein
VAGGRWHCLQAVGRGFGVVFLAGGSMLVGAGPKAAAATACAPGPLTVTTTSDAGPGSLRDAFGNLSLTMGGTICIDTTIVVSPITLTTSTPTDFTGGRDALNFFGLGAVTIDGNGATVEGNGTAGLINTFGSISIDNLTLTGGHYSDTVFASGGAIDSGGTVTVANSTVANDTASTAGNSTPDAHGGAIATVGNVTVTRSTFANDTASATGPAAIASPASSIGGAIDSGGNLTVTDSTFAGDTVTADSLGAFAGGGAMAANVNQVVTVTNSTFTNNTASAAGTGAAADGGAIRATALTMAYTTLANNTAPTGASVDLIGGAFGSGQLTSFGSVVARPQGGGTNCADLLTSSNGWNFSDDASCLFTNLTQGDREQAGDANLGPLGANGGPTQTLLPQAGSPLVDAIPNGNCGDGNGLAGFPITTDQRGLARPDHAADNCDIGAVDVQLQAVTPAGAVTPSLAITPRFTG